mmetsp:Transcript_55411/g.129670  ORF Transcript_55411/g.129670 Transcript_55411/m.129670 type:complete len:436 (+) Transcript_55411:1323-2630(+)
MQLAQSVARTRRSHDHNLGLRVLAIPFMGRALAPHQPRFAAEHQEQRGVSSGLELVQQCVHQRPHRLRNRHVPVPVPGSALGRGLLPSVGEHGDGRLRVLLVAGRRADDFDADADTQHEEDEDDGVVYDAAMDHAVEVALLEVLVHDAPHPVVGGVDLLLDPARPQHVREHLEHLRGPASSADGARGAREKDGVVWAHARELEDALVADEPHDVGDEREQADEVDDEGEPDVARGLEAQAHHHVEHQTPRTACGDAEDDLVGAGVAGEQHVRIHPEQHPRHHQDLKREEGAGAFKDLELHGRPSPPRRAPVGEQRALDLAELAAGAVVGGVSGDACRPHRVAPPAEEVSDAVLGVSLHQIVLALPASLLRRVPLGLRPPALGHLLGGVFALGRKLPCHHLGLHNFRQPTRVALAAENVPFRKQASLLLLAAVGSP